MKKIRVFFSIFFLLISFSVSANESGLDQKTEDQRYIELNDLVIENEGMVLHGALDGILVKLKALYWNPKGCYYLPSESDWECPECRCENPGDYSGQLCRRCGWPVWRH